MLIPAHGESAEQIETLLLAVFCQRSPLFRLSRVILCSDNDRLEDAFQDRSSVSFIHQEPGCGKPSAWNLMLQEAQAPYAIQISADCLPASENTFHFLLSPLRYDPGVGAATSKPVPVNQGFMSLPNIVWKCHEFVQPKLNAELFAFKRPLLEPLPDQVIHDDAYIQSVLERRGYSVIYEPRAIVFNAAPESLGEFYAQRKKNVIGNLQLASVFREKVPSVMRFRALVLMSLELLANVHGALDHARGRIPGGLVGYNLASTKTVKIKRLNTD